MSRIRATLAVVGLVLMAGCQSTSPVDHAPLSFAKYQPIYLAVSSIETVDQYQQPGHLPNVEHLIPYSPTEAMHIWAKDRIRAVGSDKTLQIIIKDASVIGEDLNTKGGFVGFITNEQSKRYTARLNVEMRIYGESAISEANIEVTATRGLTVSEDASAYRRNEAFRRLITELMEMINSEIEQNLFMYMSNYISYSQNP